MSAAALPSPSLWDRLLAYLEAGSRAVRALFEPQDGVDGVAFSIAFIALAAKLAKADGRVTRDEVRAFRRIFEIPPGEEENAARVYDLCRQETTGYETYARQMDRALDRSENGAMLRGHVLDGLFQIAMADDAFHPLEDDFLRVVADIFGIAPAAYDRLRARHVTGAHDPFAIVGVPPDADAGTLKAARRAFMRENHPDILVARGLPPEMIEIGHRHVADFNHAYDTIMRGLRPALPDQPQQEDTR